MSKKVTTGSENAQQLETKKDTSLLEDLRYLASLEDWLSPFCIKVELDTRGVVIWVRHRGRDLNTRDVIHWDALSQSSVSLRVLFDDKIQEQKTWIEEEIQRRMAVTAEDSAPSYHLNVTGIPAGCIAELAASGIHPDGAGDN